MKNPIFTLTTLAFLGLSTTYAQVKVGDNPTSINSSAAFEVESTTKGILPPRMTSAQRDAIVSPVEGLTIYNTEVNCLQWFNGTGWYNVCDGSVAIPTVFGANGVEWMDRNLGASQVATSSTDADSYGDLYQWGRAADGHEKRTSQPHDGTTNRPSTITETGAWDGKFITIPNSVNRNDWVTTQTDNAWNTGTASAPIKTATDPCPTGFRLPTEAEWQAEINFWTWSNATDPFSSPLKLPLAGYRNRSSGSPSFVDSDGFYWSSTAIGESARQFLFGAQSPQIISFNRAFGLSVRCLKD
jgi:uncharacterized protein (TIGR02145 family)